MGVLRFHLLGRFQAEFDQQPLPDLEARKLQELLAYLLLYRDRALPRECVASVLWGDCTTAQSKKYLRHALWRLQATLEPYAEHTNGSPLRVEADWVAIDQRAMFWLDVATFEAIYACVRGIPGGELDAGQIEALEAATCIYRGDLLEGCYHDWCLFERERLQNVYLAMLDKLMAYHEARHAYQACLDCGTRILRYDQASERTHRRLMRMYYRAGDRTAALRQYQRCAAALQKELDVEPGARTQALYRQIRADTLARSTLAPAEETGSAGTTGSLSQVLRRFRQVQAMLVDLHRQVQHDIQIVELALDDQVCLTDSPPDILPQ